MLSDNKIITSGLGSVTPEAIGLRKSLGLSLCLSQASVQSCMRQRAGRPNPGAKCYEEKRTHPTVLMVSRTFS